MPRLMTPEFVAAAMTACLATMVLVAFYTADPERAAMRHYVREHPTVFHVMRMCIVLLSTAVAFNLRYLVMNVMHHVWRRLAASLHRIKALHG